MFCAVALGIGSSFSLAAAAEDWADTAPTKTSQAIPWSQIGAKAGADYQGNGLAVSPAAGGARLRCVFQRLEGEATREGLWLTSTVTNTVNDRFRIMAAAVGRGTVSTVGNPLTEAQAMARSVWSAGGLPPLLSASKAGASSAHSKRFARSVAALPSTGTVQVADKLARLTRPGLAEEYSVSMDGVRQDFIIEQRPVGPGTLRVELDVTGAKVEPLTDGARLVLENSGRKIAYSRLRVTDATGKELTARMEVLFVGDEVTSLKSNSESRMQNAERSQSLLTSAPTRSGRSAPVLAVEVNDADAVYPVRIDPTFSDANWTSINPSIIGASDYIRAAVVDGAGNLYIGGYFTFVGDVTANHIARWDGSSWSALGSGMNYIVYALAVSGSNVYAGGDFTTAGGTAANYIAKWDGSSWSALGSGMNEGVRALAVSGNDVYAGGVFTTAGASAANYIAKWDGSSWTALGSGMGGGFLGTSVSALAVSGSDVYAGGNFTTAGGSAANYIAKWDGSSWMGLGSGMRGPPPGFSANVYALAVSGTDVYAGGTFFTAGGSAANFIAKWNGSSWTALGSGMSFDVYALAVSGSDLYAGGFFTMAGGSTANYIAKWDGSSWTALGSGMNNYVYALAVSGSDLYAGGFFTTAGASAANYIAKWDGSSWSALGSGMNDYVHALAVSGIDLYAGGYFTTAGGGAATNIAKWDGSSWSALGSGLGGVNYPYVFALAASGSDLYAGGGFTTAGGGAANYIAKWNGSSWTALGSGMSGFGVNTVVDALAVSGSDLYAGGQFTTAGGSAANYIAKWDGSSWSALGSGMDGGVGALVVSGSNLYAGGVFTTAGGSAANRIAKWNGNSWSALGSGMNGGHPYSYVSALAVSGSDLYAGGFFTTAGGKVSAYVARAYLPALPTLSVLRSGTDVMVSWPSADTASFTLEQAGTLATPASWVTNAASVTDDGTNKSVTLPATNSQQFFRLRRP